MERLRVEEPAEIEIWEEFPEELDLEHPTEWALRGDRLPHIWCSGCGIGAAVNAFVAALKQAEIDITKLCVVSGIGCTGRVAGYMNCDSFHTTHGRAIPFAIGLHLANPDLKVVVFSGDGDIIAIGGNHFLHAARRNLDLTVICVNNFNYGMTGGQSGPTTHIGGRTTTTPYGNPEYAFNLPLLAAACGAVYVARWTILDLGRLRNSIAKALQKRGFSFVEIISPCPVNYGRRNQIGDALDELRYYKENTIHNPEAPLEECDLSLRGKIIVGAFVDREKPTFLDLYRQVVLSRWE
ncbi:MAG: thiamine pyrophosphate-dependent enzyme [Armatimonadetes bacterium]|nr:thiamine pyrophosphate-dependent enzyme [Armatimonadota bacterium]MDW8122327.1 thiamine pyrophosphate-dependent enzyme [Armatimonadota bacterium]